MVGCQRPLLKGWQSGGSSQGEAGAPSAEICQGSRLQVERLLYKCAWGSSDHLNDMISC